MYQFINNNLQYVSGQNGSYVLTDNKEFGYVFPIEEAQMKLQFFNEYFNCIFLVAEYSSITSHDNNTVHPTR